MLSDLLDEAGQETANRIGESASFVQHDVTDGAQWSALVERTLDTHGRIDILVNNAGVLHQGPIENTS